VISFSKGIIHEYYTVALAPAIGALTGIGAIALWDRRDHLAARITMAALTAGTATWGYLLLARSATFLPVLRHAELAAGLVLAAVLLFTDHLDRRRTTATGIATLLILLAGPTSYAIETATSPATGSLPSAGPAVTGTRGGPGGNRGRLGPPPGPNQPQTPPGSVGMMPQPGGSMAGPSDGTGGLLDASTPNPELTAALLANAAEYTWVAATTGSQNAAGYQLATQHPVIAIGGFNGSDPAPTLAQFQAWVAAARIHYYIPSDGRGGPAGGRGGTLMGGSNAAAEISDWVTTRYTATTIGTTLVYDLTQPVGSGSDTPAATTAT
jgi:4-amino-4-deoxy-L-arabinose transferase-like glycosyltransferase